MDRIDVGRRELECNQNVQTSPEQRIEIAISTENGDVIHPTDQADAMATHYETMQWYVRPGCGIDDKPMINETKLDTVDSAITRDELYHVLKQLKRNKAAGTDGIPAELWKLLLDNDDAANRLLLLFNKCWDQKTIPNTWHKATVVSIFKKRNVILLEDYRPISLL